MRPFFLHELFGAADGGEITGLGGRRLSHGEIVALGERWAAGEPFASLAPGARVAMFLDAEPEQFAIAVACSLAGAVAVPCGREQTARTDRLIELVDASVAISQDEPRPTGARAWMLEDGELAPRGDVASEPRSGEQPARPAPIDDDPVLLFFSSGSSGDPKGIVESHRAVLSAVESICRYLSLAEGDRIINFSAPSFDYGFYQGLLAAGRGCGVRFGGKAVFPGDVLRQIDEYQATVAALVPTTLRVISRNPAEPLESVRLVTSTGSPFPAEVLPRLRQVFPNAEIVAMYGLTESKRVSFLPPDRLEQKPSSVGRAMPNTRLSLTGEGEVVVQGGSVMSGYWGGNDEGVFVRERGEPASLYTGDFGYLDEDGDLHLLGRRDDLVKLRDERISLLEVEAALRAGEDVEEAIAVAAADEHVSASIFVVDSKRTAEETTRAIEGRLSEYFGRTAVGRFKVKVVDDLPRLPNGKPDRTRLRELSAG